MKKNILFAFLFLLVYTTVFCQNNEALRTQAMQFYEEGKFTESLKTLDKIKDKELLPNANVGVWKMHISSILHHNFSIKYKISYKDSLYIVEIKTANIETKGVFNTETNHYVVPPVYNFIGRFQDENSILFTVAKGNQAAVFDKEGKIIIPFKNQTITERNRSWDDYDYSLKYLIVTNLDHPKLDNNIGIYDIKGRLIVEYESGELLKNDLLLAKKEGKWKFIDLKENTVLVDSIDSFEEKYSGKESDSRYFMLHTANYISVYSPRAGKLIDNVFDSYTDMSRGTDVLSEIINRKQNFSSKNEFPTEDKEEDSYLIVKKNNKQGIYNITRFEYLIEPVYDSISSYGNAYREGTYTNVLFGEPIVEERNNARSGAVIVTNNGKFGAKGIDGKTILNTVYDEIKMDVNLFFRIKDKWGFTSLTKSGTIKKPRYDFVTSVSGTWYEGEVIVVGRGLVAAYRNKRKKLYELNGKRCYSTNNPNKNERIKYYYLKNNITSSVINGKYSDFDGYEIIEKTNFTIVSKKNRLGVVDSDNAVIIPLIYENIVYNSYHSYFECHIGKKTVLITPQNTIFYEMNNKVMKKKHLIY